ncbi:MAG: hypothetical protein D6704_00525 [Nitrospirae bacterium]|nr:MAG: hypothetical protein D6704_00525 [Nitrospirota bacterium]
MKDASLLGLSMVVLGFWWLCVAGIGWAAGVSSYQVAQKTDHLHRAKIYLAAGDYRRAIEACEQYVDEAPSAEAYVYLTYVYHATQGYLDWLAARDEWAKIGQLSLSFVYQGARDLVDPPDVLARMAKELLYEGLRQQFDLAAAMANRLDRPTVDRLWQQQTAWKQKHPETWWASVPEEWGW